MSSASSLARGPKPAVREVECDCLEKRQAKRLPLLECRMPSLLSKKRPGWKHSLAELLHLEIYLCWCGCLCFT